MGDLLAKVGEIEGLFCYDLFSRKTISQEEKPLYMIHQLGHKMLYQIEKFSGELCASLGKVPRRFVQEMLYGILSRGSVQLTEIARSLGEPITLHKTHDRLSRNLSNPRLEVELEKSLIQIAAPHIGKDTLIIIDPSDIIKPYARKMEYLGEVRDGSKKEIGNGYWLYPVIGVDKKSGNIIPLVNRLYSSLAPDFISENDHILDISAQVLKATGNKGTIVMDKGGDRIKLLKPWLQNPDLDFIVNQRGDRHLIYRNGHHLCRDLVRECKLKYSEVITRITRDGKAKPYLLKFGFLPVRLPDCPKRQLYLVVTSGFGKEPFMLLTTKKMSRSRKVIWDVVESYLARWKVEETIRYIKQSYKLEDMRILTYQRMRNLITMVMAAAFFTCVHIGLKDRYTIMVGHILKAAKRIFGIPDFQYYSMADGIQHILTKTSPKRRPKKPPDIFNGQRCLFDL